MSDKTKKILNIVINVLVVIILVLVLLVTISTIASGGKGYTTIFGKAMIGVRSDSMEGDNPDSFNKGDLIFITELSEDEKTKLEVGQVITFRETIDGKEEFNTHRITRAYITSAGDVAGYYTKGDNTPGEDASLRRVSTIVGTYNGGRIPVLGYVTNFMHTTAGFFVLVVLPSLLIVVYFTINLILAVKENSKKKKDQEEAVDKEAEKERIRAELLKELQANGTITKTEENAPPAEEKPAEEVKVDEKPVEETVDETPSEVKEEKVETTEGEPSKTEEDNK